MEGLNQEFIGSLLTIYMKSGNTYEGVLRGITETRIILVTPLGKTYIITDLSNIECYCYIVKENKVVKERDVNDKIPQHKAGDIKSLTELHQMKHNEEVKEIRRKLLSKDTISGEVEYVSPISALRAAKKHSGE